MKRLLLCVALLCGCQHRPATAAASDPDLLGLQDVVERGALAGVVGGTPLNCPEVARLCMGASPYSPTLLGQRLGLPLTEAGEGRWVASTAHLSLETEPLTDGWWSVRVSQR